MPDNNQAIAAHFRGLKREAMKLSHLRTTTENLRLLHGALGGLPADDAVWAILADPEHGTVVEHLARAETTLTMLATEMKRLRIHIIERCPLDPPSSIPPERFHE